MELRHVIINFFVLCNILQGNALIAKFSEEKLDLKVNVNVTVSLIVSEVKNESGIFITLNTTNNKLEVDPWTLEVPALNETRNISLYARGAGYSQLIINTSPNRSNSDDEASITVTAFHYQELRYLELVVGWGYFAAWSISFYPQILKNFQRKSVVGFNFDFLSLNFVGHATYLVFNAGLFFSPVIKAQYFISHSGGVNPVQLNDVLFSVHAVCGTFMQSIQCCIYERGGQAISKLCRVILLIIFLFIAISCGIAIGGVITWLTAIYYFSYVKLGITFIKYCPQAYMNYKLKSTKGLSIGYAIFDFLGGSQSILQMFVIAYNYDDMGSITGDPTKLGLGLVSVAFDITFMVQHFILYRTKKSDDIDNEKKVAPNDHAFEYINTYL